MKLISTEEYRRLSAINAKSEDIKKIEKRLKKQLNLEREEYEEAIEDLNDDHEREVTKLQRKIDQAEKVRNRAVADATAEQSDVIKSLKTEQAKAISAKDSTISELTAEITTLKARLSKAGDLKIKELDITERENVIKSATELTARKAKENEDYAKELDELKKEIDSDQYNKGFTDGVSDTLREAQKGINEGVDKAYDLAGKALAKDTVVITTTQAPAQKQK